MTQINSKNTNHFGEHLTIDVYGGNSTKLNDKNFVFNFIDTLPRLNYPKLL